VWVSAIPAGMGRENERSEGAGEPPLGSASPHEHTQHGEASGETGVWVFRDV
jgi:hypothetical protein